MHLAINSPQAAISVNHDRRVVIHPRRALLEHRPNHDNPQELRSFRQPGRSRPRNWLGQIEQRSIFPLTKILCLKKFRQADNLCALGLRLVQAVNRTL